MIELHKDGALWVVTLNRPDKANSLTGAMLADLRDIFLRATAEDARAIILTGQGRVFSAGADLDEARAGLAISGLWEELSGAVADFQGLTIAALNGTLAGGAMGMVLACDLRVAVPGAKFFYPVMKLGFLPQPSDPGRLRDLVGPARAKMILMAGQKVDTDAALAWGLIDRVATPETLLDVAKELAADVLTAHPGHPVAIKQMI